jgi:hypothetical protein
MLSISLVPYARSRNGRSPCDRQGILVLFLGNGELSPLDFLKGWGFHHHPHLCLLLYLCFVIGNLLIRSRRWTQEDGRRDRFPTKLAHLTPEVVDPVRLTVGKAFQTLDPVHSLI